MIYHKKNYYFYHSALLLIAILCIFGFAVFLGRPIFINADQQLTYHPYYEEWIRLLKDFIFQGQLPFYSWYKFLGSDFYSSASIYVTSDIFIPLLMLFRSIDQALFFETLLLIIISSFSFAYFLKTFGIEKDSVKLLVSFLYAFSGMAVLFFGNYMFLRFYAFLPLLFAGVELYLKQHKFISFILAVFLLSFSSIYFMFPTSLFLIFYFYFSYRISHSDWDFLSFFKSSFKLIIYYIIGFCMSLFLNLPAIFFLLSNSRLGVVSDSSLFWDLRTMIGFLVNHGSGPFALFTDIPYIFYSGFDGHGSWYSMYGTSLVVALNITYLIKSKDLIKKYFFQILLVMNIVILFKPLNSMFHGLSDPTFRYSFLLIFMNLLLTAYVLDKVKLESVKLGYFVYSILLYLSLGIGFLAGLIDIHKYLFHLLFILSSNVFGWIVVMNYSSGKKSMYWFVTLELILSASIITWTLNADYYHYEPSLNQKNVDDFQAIDISKMFRLYIDPEHLLPSSEMNLNQSLHYKYLSVTSYDSAYEPSLRKFLQLNNINWHLIHLKEAAVLRMLGVKYFAVYNESELPEAMEFEYVGNLDFLKIYRLDNFRSIGFTYSQFDDIVPLTSTDTILWNEVAYLYPDDLKKVKSIPFSELVNFNIQWFTNNSLYGDIELKDPSFLFLSIPMNKGWKIFDNGAQIDAIDVNGGFTGLILDKGSHTIEMYFVPYGLKAGLVLSSLSFIVFLSLIIVNRAKKKQLITRF